MAWFAAYAVAILVAAHIIATAAVVISTAIAVVVLRQWAYSKVCH
jgi:hypothetical protein